MAAAAVLRHNNHLLICRRDQEQHATTSSGLPPVLLLYVANAGNLIALSSEEAAVELGNMVKFLNPLGLAEFAAVLTVFENETISYLDRWNKFCLRLRAVQVRNIILVDQWNAILETSSLAPDHPLRRFTSIGARIGFSKFVGAVSSSFTPVDVGSGVFRDGEAESAKCRIDPLTMEDLLALSRIWRLRQPPVAVSNHILCALHECTGGIPRLFEFFATARSLNSEATINDPDWQQRCTNYYVGRIKSISQNLTDPDIRKCFHGELASLFLRHRELPNADSVFASRWLNSGLLVPNESRQFLVPVNLFVRKAIDNFVSNEQTRLLRSMYFDPPTAWRALELFVFLQLRKGRTSLTGTDLRGTESMGLQFDHEQLQIIDVNQDFASDPQLFQQQHNGGRPFPAGTVVIPTWTTHPVADAVLFVNVQGYSKPQIIFVQVSTSSYAEHNSKIPHLPIIHKNWKLSVLQSYQTAFGVAENSPRDMSKGKLPQSVKYVYVTTSEALMGPVSQSSGHSVFLMRKANIKKMNEQLWLEMTQDR